MRLPIYKLSLESMSIHEMLYCFNRIKKGIVVFEDIDLAKSSQEDASHDGGGLLKDKGVRYRDLLNVLDGLDTPEGIIFILTSNNKDRIGKALLRPGRIDVDIEFDLMDRPEIEEYVSRFYGQTVSVETDKRMSPADLRAVCLANDLNGAIELIGGKTWASQGTARSNGKSSASLALFNRNTSS